MNDIGISRLRLIVTAMSDASHVEVPEKIDQQNESQETPDMWWSFLFRQDIFKPLGMRS